MENVETTEPYDWPEYVCIRDIFLVEGNKTITYDGDIDFNLTWKDKLPKKNFTTPPLCMPDEFKCEDYIQAYRNYYINKMINVKLITFRKANKTNSNLKHQQILNSKNKPVHWPTSGSWIVG